MKYLILSGFIFLFSADTHAQKGNSQLLLNAGTTISLTQSSAYKPGIYLAGVFGYSVRTDRNDAVTAGIGYQTIKFKYAQSGGLNMTDIKLGYRFFPSVKAAVYLHPTVGVGFFSGSYGGNKANINTGIALGFMPRVGSGNLNVFAAFNQFRFSPGLSLLHLGAGYQLDFKGNKQKE